MLIPNSTIIIRASNGACSVKQQPRYYAKMYAIVWRRKLLDQDGLTVVPLPDDVPDSLRYSVVESIEQAERSMLAYFANTTAAKDPENDRNTRQATDLFRMVFPNGLREEIAQLLKEDAERALAASKVEPLDHRPHPSFLEIGVSADEARSLQRAGFATLSDIPDSLVEVCQAEGITAFRAARLIMSMNAAKAEANRPVVANPVAAKTAKASE